MYYSRNRDVCDVFRRWPESISNCRKILETEMYVTAGPNTSVDMRYFAGPNTSADLRYFAGPNTSVDLRLDWIYWMYRYLLTPAWIYTLSKTVTPGQQFTEFQCSPSETVTPGQQFTELPILDRTFDKPLLRQ